MDKYVKQIEAVQRRSARFVKNCWQRTPETDTNLLNDLDWPSLQSRRKVAHLTMFHKTIHSESALEIQSYIKRRNFCQLGSYHEDKFIELKPNTEVYRNSFYCRTITEWNSLPSNDIGYYYHYYLFLLSPFLIFDRSRASVMGILLYKTPPYEDVEPSHGLYGLKTSTSHFTL